MSATINLSNGQLVEILLFNSICKTLKRVAGVNTKIAKAKYSELIWTGLIAIRRLWIKSTYSEYEMDSRSAGILSTFHLCNDDGSITKNIRNIILSLCRLKDGKIFMIIPPLADDDDPIPAEEILDLGSIPDFPSNKNPL
jgi:hypothetical protein